MSKLNIKFSLFLILVLGAFLRMWDLARLPISLFGDEIDVGYHAWSLFNTGRDYMGHFSPLYIQSLSEWRAPLLMYVTAPFVGILGPTSFAVRLPSAILGIVSVYLVFILSTKLFLDKKTGLIAALLLATSPWHIHYSRTAFEVSLLTSLILLGTLFFVYSKYYLAVFIFILTFYTYSTANIFTPLLLISLITIFRPKLNLQKNWIKVTILLISLTPILYFVLSGPAAGRFRGISIFNNPTTVDKIITIRTEPWVLDSKLEPLFHNKPVTYLNIFFKNYASALSTNFLFLNGDPNFRHSIANGGELFMVLAPLLLVGFAVAITNFTKKEHQLIVSWLFLAPIPSALTQGGGEHATRLFLMLPPLIILSGVGLSTLVSLIKSIFIRACFVFIFLFILATSTLNYWHYFSSHYRYQSARIWQYGYEQIFSQFPDVQNSKNRLFINNTYEPSLLKFAFFTKYPPKYFQQNFKGDATATDVVPGFSGFKFGDNIYFGQLNPGYDLSQLLSRGDVYLAAQKIEIPGNWDWSKEPPNGFKVISVVKDMYKDPLFTLVQKE